MVQEMGISTKKESDPHLTKFERFERDTKQPSWVSPLRRTGITRFAELGFPTLQHEDWRFTNVAPIAKLPFKPGKMANSRRTPREHNSPTLI